MSALEDQIESELLERLIDRHGLKAVLETLAEIACQKADHVQENWQDRITAEPWRAAAREVEIVALKVSV